LIDEFKNSLSILNYLKYNDGEFNYLEQLRFFFNYILSNGIAIKKDKNEECFSIQFNTEEVVDKYLNKLQFLSGSCQHFCNCKVELKKDELKINFNGYNW